jgi:hypothetical protein
VRCGCSDNGTADRERLDARPAPAREVSGCARWRGKRRDDQAVEPLKGLSRSPSVPGGLSAIPGNAHPPAQQAGLVPCGQPHEMAGHLLDASEGLDEARQAQDKINPGGADTIVSAARRPDIKAH